MSDSYAHFPHEWKRDFKLQASAEAGRTHYASVSEKAFSITRELPEKVRNKRGKSSERPVPENRRYFAHLEDPTTAAERLDKDAEYAQLLHARIQVRQGGK